MIKLLMSLMYSLPSLISIIQHYTEITKKETFTDEDLEKAKAYLASLKWKSWDEL